MKRVDKLFWIGFVFFCVSTMGIFKLFNFVDISKLGLAEDGILVGALLLCGVVF